MLTKYNAFISYRHSDLDMEFAKKIHKGLETFKVPHSVKKKTGMKKIDRVFRDQEELPIGSDLGSNITEALANSEWLIVICSPRLPQSYWCLTEIETFIKMHDRNHVLAVLVEGEPEESFPEILRIDENGNSVEPLAADVRGATPGERNKKFKTEIIRLLAPLLGVTYDDLRQRHRERRMKRVIAFTSSAAAIVAALGISFGVYNAAQNQQIKRNQSMFLASVSDDLYEDGNREDAVLVALEALPGKGNKRPLVADAEYALSRALGVYSAGNNLSYDRVLETDLTAKYVGFTLSDDNYTFYTHVIDSNNTTYLFHFNTGEELLKIKAEDDESGTQIPVLGTVINNNHLTLLQQNGIRAYQMDMTEDYHSCDNEKHYYLYAIEDDTVAMIGSRTIDFYNLADGKLIDSFDIAEVVDSLGASFQQKDCAMKNHILAIALNSNDADAVTEQMLLIDYKTGNVSQITMPRNYVVAMAMDDKHLYVVNADSDAYKVKYYETNRPVEIQSYDLATGELLWAVEENDFHQYMETYGSVAKVKDDVLTVSLYNRLLIFNASTGEVTATANLSHGIVDYAFHGEELFICDNAGTIEICDLASGSLASSPLASTGKEVRQVAFSEDMIAIRSYLSNEVNVLKYLPSHSLAVIDDDEAYDNLDTSYKSPSGKIIGGLYGYTAKDQTYRFFDSETCEEIAKFEITVSSFLTSAAFLDEDTFAVSDANGYVAIYQFSTGTLTETEAVLEGSDTYGGDAPMIKSNGHAYGYHDHLIYDVDLLGTDADDKMKIATHHEEDKITNLVVSDDGSKLLALTEKLGLCTVEFDNSIFTPVDFPYQVATTLYSDSVLQFSQDGSLLAVACRDDYIRILKADSLEQIAEIPYVFNYRIFVYFLADNSRVLVQGDDYYLRAYDLPTGEMTYVSSGQYNSLLWIEENKENGRLIMKHGGRINMLDYDSLHDLATIPNGQLYLADQEQFVGCIATDAILYRVDILSTEELIEEANRQFPDAKLTEQKRIKYFLN